jgi:hypothetical protein
MTKIKINFKKKVVGEESSKKPMDKIKINVAAATKNPHNHKESY